MLKKLSCIFKALNHILFAVMLLLVFSAAGACEEKLQKMKELTEEDVKNATFLLDDRIYKRGFIYVVKANSMLKY